MSLFLKNKENNDRLVIAVDRMKNNKRVVNKVMKELIKFKYNKRPPINKTQLRLYYRSIYKIKEDLQIDLSIQLLNLRMVQFINWFKYIMSKRLTLVSSVHNRYKRDYPYKKLGVGRVVNVIFKPIGNEPQYVLDIYKNQLDNLKI